MQHLNIPLSRHTKTTRPLGRVVWLLVGLLVVGGFLAYRVGVLWFSRGSILSLAPVNTILAVELQLTQKTSPFLHRWLAGVPLISGRSLELADLSGSIKGELTVFVTKDGQHSVAIRADEDALPSDLLSQFGIVSQEQGSFVLLSSTLIALHGTPAWAHPPLFPSVEKTWLGRVILPDSRLGGNLFLTKTELTAEIQTPKRDQSQNPGLPGVALALGGLAWREDGFVLSGLERLLAGNSLILEHAGTMDIAIVPAQSGLEILLQIEAPEVTSSDIIKELEQIGAFARPTIITQILPDGSKLEEILIQPELVSVEEISTGLGVSYRVPTGGGSYILAAFNNGSVLFSNSQVLLEHYAQGSQTDSTGCIDSSNRVDPSFLVGEASLDHLQPQLGLIHEIFNDFSTISVEFKKYSTVLHLCMI